MNVTIMYLLVSVYAYMYVYVYVYVCACVSARMYPCFAYLHDEIINVILCLHFYES